MATPDPEDARRRYTKRAPCPICGGHADLPQGRGVRCYGYADRTGNYARCTREEHAGDLQQNSDGTFSHRLEGECRCGATHGLRRAEDPREPPPTTTMNGGTVRHQIKTPDGALIAVHARKGSGAGKRVWWEGNLNGHSTADLLYRAEHLAGAPPGELVVLCEGEPAADAAGSLGLLALGTVCGAAGTLSADAAALLAERDVWLWPDNDEQGADHMERNAQALRAVGARTLMVRWAAAPPKGDAVDYVAGGGTREGLVGMVGDVEAEPDPDPDPFFIDWADFWARDRAEEEWLLDDIIARGRGHSIYAKHKVGKSLITLWCALELAKAGVVVVYLDYEMTEEDIKERLEDMGVSAETDLSLLRYALFPMISPLDSKAGGEQLLEVIDQQMTKHPGKEVCVVIDTISRAVEGEENPSDTIRAFYTHTGIGMKRRGCAWVRLDHSGWEGGHARGSSAKGDDVDVIWKLVEVDNGLKLEREAARMGWVPEKVTLRKETNPLRFERTDESWPNGTLPTAELLDGLGVPLDVGRDKARSALKTGGHKVENRVLAAALRWRKTKGQNLSVLSAGREEANDKNPLDKGEDLSANRGQVAEWADENPLDKGKDPSDLSAIPADRSPNGGSRTGRGQVVENPMDKPADRSRTGADRSHPSSSGQVGVLGTNTPPVATPETPVEEFPF